MSDETSIALDWYLQMCGPQKMFLINKKIKNMVIGYAEYESDIRFVILYRLTKILPTFTKVMPTKADLGKSWQILVRRYNITKRMSDSYPGLDILMFCLSLF
jgi:hypothetical protein